MKTRQKFTSLMFLDRDMQCPEFHTLNNGQVAIHSQKQPEDSTRLHNEDAAAILTLDSHHTVLAIADGCGGHRSGEIASSTALQTLISTISECYTKGEDLRNAILNGIEAANSAVINLNLGAMTTLSVLEISGKTVRPYHIGDSPILAVSRKGTVRFQTLAHAPTAYALEAGVLDEAAALNHKERHLVSNLVGSPDMRIEIGAACELAPNDTVLIASDGLFDNFIVEEVIQRTRKGPLSEAVANLSQDCIDRMVNIRANRPSHPDDLTLMAYRPNK